MPPGGRARPVTSPNGYSCQGEISLEREAGFVKWVIDFAELTAVSKEEAHRASKRGDLPSPPLPLPSLLGDAESLQPAPASLIDKANRHLLFTRLVQWRGWDDFFPVGRKVKRLILLHRPMGATGKDEVGRRNLCPCLSWQEIHLKNAFSPFIPGGT